MQLSLKRAGLSKQAEGRRIMKRLRQDAKQITRHFRLTFKELKAERSDAYGHYGICYDDGTIRIRLRHATSGKPLKYSSLINTLCHELAHLRYFDHGDDFKRLYLEILGYARERGIYTPSNAQKNIAQPTGPVNKNGVRRQAANQQLNLFA